MDDDPYPSMLLLAEIAQVSAGFWLINGLFFIALLVFSAFISGSEVVFFSLTQQDLRDLQAKSDEKSQLVLKLVAHPERLLGTILVLNVFLKIFLVTLSTFMTWRSEEHTSELQSRVNLVCRLLLEKKNNKHEI